MTNATAAQAYTAVRAIELAMEDTNEKGYHNTIQMDTALAKIIADNGDVETTAEALAGIHLASGGSTAVANDDIEDDTAPAAVLRGEYKANIIGGTLNLPVAATNVLFIQHNYTYVTSLSDPA